MVGVTIVIEPEEFGIQISGIDHVDIRMHAWTVRGNVADPWDTTSNLT